MKYLLLFFHFYLISNYDVVGQTRTVSGKVIFADPDRIKPDSSDVFIQPGAVLFTTNNIVIGKADEKGGFDFQVNKNVKQIKVGSIGYESELIELSDSCEFLEIILMPNTIYDFVSERKAARLRSKDRENLPKLYELAYHKRIFRQPNPCR